MSVQSAADNRPAAAEAVSAATLTSLVRQRLTGQAAMAPVSLTRVCALIDGFANFLAASGVNRATGIKEAHASAFVHSLARRGTEPSLATMHLRRSALRIFFKEAKTLGLLDSDPSADIILPPRTYRDLRPLTDKEIDRCRSFATGIAGEPGLALAWALAEAGARVPELGHVTAGNADLDAGLVQLPGCSSTIARRASLTPWGKDQLDARLGAAPALGADQSLLGSGSRGSIHELIASTLRRAGIANKPAVRPNSVPAWRGVHELDNGATIDEVARLLGMRSLDRTASFIGFEWRSEA